VNQVTVSREVFEYQMVPWIGRQYAAWLRVSARPHPTDEHRMVLLPERIYRVFTRRAQGSHATPAELESMGYPLLPEDDELWEARQEQAAAAATGDVRYVAEVHRKIEALESQLENARRAIDTWQRADPTQLQEQIAWELAHAPHARVLVGIP
jgi:hypothetical protein